MEFPRITAVRLITPTEIVWFWWEWSTEESKTPSRTRGRSFFINEFNARNIRLLPEEVFSKIGTGWWRNFRCKNKSHQTKRPSRKKGEQTNGKP